MIPQSCQPVGTRCHLHLGKAQLHRPGVQQICSGTGCYKHLPKRCCTVRSVGAPGANPGTVDPVAPSSRCSVHDVSLRSGRRPRSLGSCQGYVLREMGFRGVCRVPWPPARCESKAADGSLPRWRAVPEQRATHHFYGTVSATLPKDCYALPTLVVAVSSPASYCHGPDVFNLCWEIFLYLPAPFSPFLLLSVYLYRARV